MKNQIVVVPWDFSDHAKSALKYAFQNFRASDLRVICVLERPNPYEPGIDWDEKAESQARERCEQDFLKAVSYPSNSGMHFFATFGDPAIEIVRFARDQHADFIVISTHGRSGVKKLLMGSIAEQVARKSKCPIILLSHEWFEDQELAPRLEQGQSINDPSPL